MNLRWLIPIVLCLVLVRTLPAQAVNDECAGGIAFTALPFHFTQDTRLASQNPSDPPLDCQDSSRNGKTVWFTYTADSSRYVVFSTLGSTPSDDYDIVMGVFTGPCGALNLVRCNDDTLETRQSMVGMFVTAGTTYHIMIGEWGGGGPFGGFPTGGDLVFSVYPVQLPPLVRGPRNGMVNVGMITTTENFPEQPELPERRTKLRKPNINESVAKLPPPPTMTAPTGLYGSNMHTDPAVEFHGHRTGPIARAIPLQQFEGIPQTNYIPPDPIIAVGPEHVMVAVNSTFRIFAKNGDPMKIIDMDKWYDQVLPGASTFDPIVAYDHFSGRWLMMALHVDDAKGTAAILLSTSDDSNPLGTWYNWSLPAHLLGDSAVSNWTDYARLGFDKDAVYITGNQFGFITDFAYAKLRIIPKTQLYANTGRSLSWKDFWDFRNPENTYDAIFGLRPSIAFGDPHKQFLLNDSPYFLGTFFTLWTLDSVLTTPVISAKNVPVVQYFPSPDADQKEGSTIPVETFGADIRSEPIYRDSALWAVHTVASGPQKQYSAVRYVKIDPFTGTTLEDAAFGAEGYWHSYAALMVNSLGDVTVTYSRSGNDEYIGAYVSGRRKNDPPGLSASVLLREGRGNYVVDYGSGRNRWGDYSGIGLDPSDGISVWTHTEFAAAKNTWGTWVTRSQLGPLPGVHLTSERSYINFGTRNVGTASDTVTFTMTNDGTQPLTISSIGTSSSSFVLLEPKSVPFIIPSLGSATVRVVFSPKAAGVITDSIRYCAAEACITLNTLTVLTGTGFQVTPAAPGTLYAASGAADGGKCYQINSFDGTTTLLTQSGLSQITSLRVHPRTKELIGLDPTGSIDGGTLYRLSTTGTAKVKLCDIPVTNLKGLAFIDDSTVFMADFNGRLFRVNIRTGQTLQAASTGMRISGLAVDPKDSSLWFSLRATSGTKDGFYRFSRDLSSFVLMGTTGLGVANADLLFDGGGRLFLLSGIGSTANTLVTADPVNGSIQRNVPLGRSNITALATDQDVAVSVVRTANDLPAAFALLQNYPNPFNPLTRIDYDLSDAAEVRLSVYDITGRVVQDLVQGRREAGRHHEFFDATGLPSGVYYYRIIAGVHRMTRKMLLLK